MIKLKYLSKKHLIIFCVLVIILSFQISARAELYPTSVTLSIVSNGEVIGQDDLFEILEMEDYILIPIVALSRWLELDLSYNREEELLTVYNELDDRTVVIDLRFMIYYEFPEWSIEPPELLEADFFVTKGLIEYLFNLRVDWQPRRQELILDFDYPEEEIPEITEPRIRVRPEKPVIEPDITGPDFSIGSIQYKIGFDYRFEDDVNDSRLIFNNLINVHGRLDDWAFSGQQILEYDFEAEEFNLDYPLLRAQNPENDRLIIIGDNRFNLPETLGRPNIRGLHLQYPLIQQSDRRAYTSIYGEASEGSTVSLYVNERKIDEAYIYKGESEYYFENVPLTVERTNIFRVVIIDIEDNEIEMVKKVAGSLNIYEEGRNEGLFTIGSYNRSAPVESIIEVGGLQFKYALSNNTSLFWEVGAKRVFDDSVYQGIDAGSLVRIAIRPEDLPLVMMVEWLAGSDVSIIDHGVRASTLYTRENGHIKASLSYVPPIVSANTKADAGQNLMVNLQHDISENWLMDLNLHNIRSIADMEDFDMSLLNLAFDYRDRARNSFTISTEIGQQSLEVDWDDIDLTESGRSWFDIIVEGRAFIGSSRVGGEVIYIFSDIDFFDQELEPVNKREDEASLNFNISSNITDNLVLSGDVKTSFIWFEGERINDIYGVDLRARLRTGQYTFITASASTETEIGDNGSSDKHELELSIRYNVPRTITLNAGIKRTYLPEESYLSGKTGLDYRSPENDWRFKLDLEYIAPFGEREVAQQRAKIEYIRHLFSGVEGSISLSRRYSSRTSDNPIHEISFSLSQVLGFARDDVIGQKYNRGNHDSFIGGVVYLDLQGNGVRDEDDPLIEGVTLFRDRSRSDTDEDGYFIFENIRPGLYEVGVDLRDLPEDYRVVTDNKLIQLRENENIYVEYGLTKYGSISGQFVIDEETSDFEVSDELPLYWIEVKVEEINRTVFTRNDGSFYIGNLPLGQYTLKIMRDSLPVETNLVGDFIIDVVVSPEDLSVENIEIPLEVN